MLRVRSGPSLAARDKIKPQILQTVLEKCMGVLSSKCLFLEITQVKKFLFKRSVKPLYYGIYCKFYFQRKIF